MKLPAIHGVIRRRILVAENEAHLFAGPLRGSLVTRVPADDAATSSQAPAPTNVATSELQDGQRGGHELRTAADQQGPGDLERLLNSGDTWSVDQ